MVDLPVPAREGTYALQVQGDSMLPLYRDGDVLVVEPNAAIRKGDRVVVRTTGGEVMAKVLVRRSVGGVELLSLNPEHPNREIPAGEIDFLARVVWASQ
jgi:phage repressor protein C with HTH and peptisase S24 domain